MAGLARPVRSPANSCFNVATAPFMRRFTSSLSNGGSAAIGPSLGPTGVSDPRLPGAILRLFGDNGVPSPAPQDLGQIALLVDREHHDGYAIFARQRYGRCIHHFKITRQPLVVGEK